MIVIAALFVSASAAAQPNASTVLANVQAFYANKQLISATFHQAVTIATYNKTTTSDGKLWLAKPDRFRFDYTAKVKTNLVVTRTFISDGTSLWVIDHQNKQLVQSPINGSALPAAWSFLTGNLGAQFNATLNTSGTFGTANSTVVELTPKQPSAQYKQLFFVVDPANFSVTESIVIDSSGNTNHFTLTNPNFKATVPATTFQVNPKSVPNYKHVVVK